MMNSHNSHLGNRLRLAGGLIISGLAVQAVSLFWSHPLSFIVFISVGTLLLAIGIVIYLLTILSLPQEDQQEAGPPIRKMSKTP
ncbi:MAG TPA: hypothetical protein VJV96_12035 [Candidatus Angelobacter sp.]|jgi:uncharacterized membrane protein|nr:hypothetical protein [Candidatus Angelobacter sp.]